MTSPQRSELFMSSCGAPAALAIQVRREGQPEVDHRVFETPFVLLGRDERNPLCLEDSQVSRRHAYLQVIAGGLFCIDLGSRTGVHWEDGARLSGWVVADDVLRIGPFLLRLTDPAPPPGAGGDVASWDPLAAEAAALLRLADPSFSPDVGGDAASWDPLAADAAGAPSAPPWALELPNGVRWRINRPLTLLGKSSRCKLRTNTSSASQFHCSLVRTPKGVWAIDLLSRSGTFLNGEPMTWALLQEGDELRIGDLVLHFRDGAPAAGAVSVDLAEGEGVACLSPPAPDAATGPDGGAALPDEETAPAAYSLTPRAPVHGSLGLPSGIPVRVPNLPAPVSGELASGLVGPLVHQFSLMQQQMLEQFHQTMMMMAQVFGNLHRDQMGLIREELDQLQRVTQELQTLHVEMATRPPTGPATVNAPPARADNGHKGGPPQPAPPAPALPPAPTRATTPPEQPPAPAADPETIHALLCQRMAALEQERQSRWDKILRFMRGK